MVVEPTGMKVPVKFGDSRSSRSRDIRLPHFVRATPAYAGHHMRAKRRKALQVFLAANLANTKRTECFVSYCKLLRAFIAVTCIC